MSAVRISGAIFVILMLLVLGGAVFLPAPGAPEATGTISAISALGLAWFFAVWAALVASMVFLILWTGAGFVQSERAMGSATSVAEPPAPATTEAERPAATRTMA